MSTIKLKGSSSGEAEVTVAAAAGTPTFTLPTTVGSANQLLKNSGTAGTLQYASVVEDSNGKVGIGTTSPATKLHVDGTASVGYDATHALRFYNQDKNNYSSITNNIATGTSNAQLAFRTGQGEALVIQNDKNVKVTDGDLVIGTGGHGIDFSAQTTSSATGATPSTSSGDERLEHYEKGTWTPVINKAGTSGSIGSLNDTFGRYTRCGDLLWISFYVYKAAGDTFGSGSDRWYISGLPFSLTTLSTGAYQFIPVGYFTLNGGSVNQVNHNSRWQSNSTNGADTITMYGTSAGDNWSSGIIEMSGAGVFQLA